MAIASPRDFKDLQRKITQRLMSKPGTLLRCSADSNRAIKLCRARIAASSDLQLLMRILPLAQEIHRLWKKDLSDALHSRPYLC